jgi:hypothetical protein
VLLDKRRHWRALSIVLALNEEAESLYRLIYGDKDTFLLGWLLAGAAHAVVPHRPFADDHVLVQRDFAGAPLFQHRTNAKWNYDGTQIAVPGFVHEAACLAALADLKRRWGGRVFAPPPPGAAASAVAHDLAANGPLELEVAADQRLTLELFPHGEIGAGRSYDRQNWSVESDGNDATLLLLDADRVTYRLHRRAPGHWEGMRLRLPQTAVRAWQNALRATQPAFAPDLADSLVDDLLRAAGFPAADPCGDAALSATFVLLDRAAPGAAKRLTALAEARRAAEPHLAHRLDALANAVAAAASESRPLKDATAVLHAGYIGPGGSVE